jgi:hypothetical protein
MKPKVDRILSLQAQMFTTTGHHYMFRSRWKSERSKIREYHIVPIDAGEDQGFHLYRTRTFGIKWYRNSSQAVRAFLREYNSFIKHIMHRQVQINDSASLPVITQLPMGKAGSALLL